MTVTERGAEADQPCRAFTLRKARSSWRALHTGAGGGSEGLPGPCACERDGWGVGSAPAESGRPPRKGTRVPSPWGGGAEGLRSGVDSASVIFVLRPQLLHFLANANLVEHGPHSPHRPVAGQKMIP